MKFASSISTYELVPPPAPTTVARPTTLGACQVRLQLSMLLLPSTWRMNFWATKFTSFVAFEQLNRPTPWPPFRSVAARSPPAARSSASSQLVSRRTPLSLTRGSVSRDCPLLMASSDRLSRPDRSHYGPRLAGGGRASRARRARRARPKGGGARRGQ